MDSRECAAFRGLVVEWLAVGAASVAGWPGLYETGPKRWIRSNRLFAFWRVLRGSHSDRFPLAGPLTSGTVCCRLVFHLCRGSLWPPVNREETCDQSRLCVHQYDLFLAR